MVDRTSDQFLMDAYEGTGGFADGSYLIPHPREKDTKFAQRKELATYPNLAQKMVNIMMGFLWRQSPNREADGLYAAFQENADGANTKLETLLFTYQRLAMILGTVYIIVDKEPTQGSTKATENLPYLVARLPGQLAAESKRKNGAWTSVTFSEQEGSEIRYRTYTDKGWKVARDLAGDDIIEQGSYFSDGRSLGRVPVVKYHIAKPLNPTSSRTVSWFKGLADLNWAIYNRESELTELFRGQTFSLLALPVSDPAEAERLTDLTVGTENAISYNPAGGGQPAYIAPPPDPVQLYMTKIDKLADMMYKMANLEFIGSVQPSGEALKYHFDETNSCLGGMAEMGEAAELDIARLVYLWQNKVFKGAISYPKQFNLTDLAGAINTALDSISLQIGPEFNRAIKKRLAKQILSNDTAPATMTAIDAEIDAQSDGYGNRIQQQAGM